MGTEIDGVNGIIKNTTSDGDVTIKGNDGGSEISALILDMSDAGTATFNHDIKLSDSGKATFGAGSDLQIYHDGSNSIISNSTGRLDLRGANISIKNLANSEFMLQATENGAVDLYHNNVKKLETTSAGIDVTGTVTATGTSVFASLDISGDIDVDGTTNLDIVDIDGAVNMATTLVVGGVITVIDGSTSAPSITNAGDTNSGIYFPADDNIGLVVGGSRKLLANSTGVTIDNGTFVANGGAVFNEGSADVDFRVESNGNTHMLFVDGGNNRVGIGTTPDLGAGLHIRTADSGASANAAADELVIEQGSSGNGAGLSILSATDDTCNIFFGDSDDNDIAGFQYNHANNDLTITAEASEAMRFDGKVISTGGETAADVNGGGICLNQAATDLKILSAKSSDIAHGITDSAETDTYFAIAKSDSGSGGAIFLGITEHNQAIDLQGLFTNANTTTASSAVGVVRARAWLKSGTGSTQDVNGDQNIFTAGAGNSVRFLVKGDGDIYYDGADQGAYDSYDDAMLVRSWDLSHNKNVINSKFDAFVKYNHEDLAKAELVGREEDGTPNHFISLTGMQRLHNGAIWQQYEKTQRLTQAMYELAKETLGEEKAKSILDKHEVKLLN